VSAQPQPRRSEAVEAVAGLMAAAALFTGLVAIVYKPTRIATGAIVIALVAAAMGGRHRKLAAWAVAITAASWLLGMAIAVWTKSPIF
jgi:hypothetical protein